MNVIGLLASVLHIVLLVSIYLLVPELAPKEQVEDIKHWVLASFSGIFLLLMMVSAKDKVNIFIIFFVGAIVISGILWWVPSYIPKEDQELATHLLIISSSVFITIISAIFSLSETESLGYQQTGVLESLAGGRRRRR